MSDVKKIRSGPMVTIVEAPQAAANPRVAQLADSDNELRLRYRTLSVELDGKKQDHPLRNLDVHLWRPQDIYTRFSTHPELGLEAAALARKVATGQKNSISPPPSNIAKKIFSYVFLGFNALMWVAFVLTVLSYQPFGSMDGHTPAAFNLGVACLLQVVIWLSAAFYAWVDFSSSKVMSSIKSLITQEASVIRDGRLITVPSADVVVGDLVQLSIGQRVPADIRLIQVSSDVAFDRALLTGESDPVAGSVEPTDQNVMESHNIAMSCTFVVQGTARGIVYAIGDDTAVGRIFQLSGRQKQTMTTIQAELNRFTIIISTVAVTLFCISIIFWATYVRSEHSASADLSQAIINSIGCLTAFVPQGLPVCVALSLTIVAKRMAARKVLVKNLATVEELGCMSVLASDKTGTLTQGKMHVQSCGFVDETFDADMATSVPFPAMKQMQAVARLCNGAQFDDSTIDEPVAKRLIKGDATDSAVLRFAADLPDDSELLAGHRKLFEIPFNSKNKWMMTVYLEEKSNKASIMIKGAPDILFKRCTSVLRSDGSSGPLYDSEREALSFTQERWSNEGQRVIALCRKVIGPEDARGFATDAAHELAKVHLQDFTLVGLLGIRDPPREGVREAIQNMRDAHLRVFMVTGDFKLTAAAIARSVGIITNEKVDTIHELRNQADARHLFAQAAPISIRGSEPSEVRSLVLVGDDVETLNPEEWNMAVGFYQEMVFARTTPEQKLKIVEQLQLRGHTVGVTGDGVNDAPALKAADIGIAMGAGSDVAKEAASMVLLNNDFSSIVFAIESGRLVFDNLKKVILFLMPAGTYAEFMTVVATVFLGQQAALSSFLQVAFCIFNDIPVSMSIMVEGPESDLMKRKPRNPRTQRLTDWRFFAQIYLFIGLMIWPSCFGMWFYYMGNNGIGFSDLIFVWENWGNGLPYTSDELTNFVNVGGCVFYITMLFMQFGSLLAVRNRKVSIFQSNPLRGPRQNRAIFLSMTVSVCVGVFFLYFPPFQNLFGTSPIPVKFWFIPMALATGVVVADEIRKLIVRSFPNSFVAKAAW